MMVNIHEAKAKLSKLLKLLEKGEKVFICKRNIPIAELTPIKKKKGKRKLGLAQGKVTIDMTHFFDPMSDEELAEWEKPIFPKAS